MTVFFIASIVYEWKHQANSRMSSELMAALDYSILFSIVVSIATEMLLVITSLIGIVMNSLFGKITKKHSIVVWKNKPQISLPIVTSGKKIKID